MEHLFKLKKDGKTVGYLELYGRPKGVIFSPFVKGVWVPYDVNNSAMDFDTANLFVTKDKNGKDVFAGDKVKAGSWYFEVIWQKYGYGLEGEKSGWWRQIHEFENIELIEDKQDG